MKVVGNMTQNAPSLSVRGPDGRPLTLADLPKPGISRWVTRRKAEVVAAVTGGLLSEEEALLQLEEEHGCERPNLHHDKYALHFWWGQ